MFFGLPTLRNPSGFLYNRVWRVMDDCGFRRVCPIHIRFLPIKTLLMGFSCVISHSASLVVILARQIRRMHHRHRLMKVWRSRVISRVTFHISQPCRSIVLSWTGTFGGLMRLRIWLDRQVLDVQKLLLAFDNIFLTHPMSHLPLLPSYSLDGRTGALFHLGCCL